MDGSKGLPGTAAASWTGAGLGSPPACAGSSMMRMVPLAAVETICLSVASRAEGRDPAYLNAAARVSPGEYACIFDAELVRLVDSGHSHLVFGDIDLAAHRDWLEPACARAGLTAVFPLWGMGRADVALQIIARGIRARLVCVDTRWLTASFCGREYDAALLGDLPPGVCPCGEGGEFHTFVFDAPGFAHPLPIINGAQRVVQARPPMPSVRLVMQTLELASQ